MDILRLFLGAAPNLIGQAKGAADTGPPGALGPPLFSAGGLQKEVAAEPKPQAQILDLLERTLPSAPPDKAEGKGSPLRELAFNIGELKAKVELPDFSDVLAALGLPVPPSFDGGSVDDFKKAVSSAVVDRALPAQARSFFARFMRVLGKFEESAQPVPKVAMVPLGSLPFDGDIMPAPIGPPSWIGSGIRPEPIGPPVSWIEPRPVGPPPFVGEKTDSQVVGPPLQIGGKIDPRPVGPPQYVGEKIDPRPIGPPIHGERIVPSPVGPPVRIGEEIDARLIGPPTRVEDAAKIDARPLGRPDRSPSPAGVEKITTAPLGRPRPRPYLTSHEVPRDQLRVSSGTFAPSTQDVTTAPRSIEGKVIDALRVTDVKVVHDLPPTLLTSAIRITSPLAKGVRTDLGARTVQKQATVEQKTIETPISPVLTDTDRDAPTVAQEETVTETLESDGSALDTQEVAIGTQAATERPIERAPLSNGDKPSDFVQADIERVQAKVIEQIEELAATRPNGRVTIKLTPEDLGSITVTVRSFGEGVEAQVTASNDNVRHALHAHRADLVQTAESRGLQINSLTVGSEQNTDTQQQSQGRQHGQDMRQEFSRTHNLWSARHDAPAPQAFARLQYAGLDTIA